MLLDCIVRTYTIPGKVVRSRGARSNDPVEIHLASRYFTHELFTVSLTSLKRSHSIALIKVFIYIYLSLGKHPDSPPTFQASQ